MRTEPFFKKICILLSFFLSMDTSIFSQNSEKEQLKAEREAIQKEKDWLEKEKAKLQKEKEEFEKNKNKLPDFLEDTLESDSSKKSPDISEESFFKLEDSIVVTATKKEQKASEAPASIYIVTEQQIKERGYRVLTDALADLPGFNFIHAYGVWPDLMFQRGTINNSNQRSLVYIDGIPDNILSENSILAGTLRFPLHNVERIEVVNGPASALYGANAFNGVINIITKNGKDKPGHEVSAMYGAWESNGKNPGYSATITSRGSVGKDLNAMQYSASAYYYNTDGPYFGDQRRLDKPNTSPNNVPYYYESKACGGQCQPNANSVGYYWSNRYNIADVDTYNITGKFSYKGFRFESVNHQYIAGSGNFQNGTRRIDYKDEGLDSDKFDTRNNFRRLGVANGIISERGQPGAYWNFRNNSVYTAYLWTINKKVNLDSEIIARSTTLLNTSMEALYKNPGPYAFYKPDDVTINPRSRMDYSNELREKLNYEISSKLSATVGTEINYTVVPRGYNSYQNFKYMNYGIYGQLVYTPIQMISFTFGYRYDENTLYGKTFNPRISAVIKPTENFTIKLLYGTGFRAPSGWELFSATSARKENINLTPERMKSHEIGLGYRAFKKYYFSLNGFYNQVKDIILEVRTDDSSLDPVTKLPPAGKFWNQNQNAGDARIYGIEFTSNIPLHASLNFNLNTAHTKGEFDNLSRQLTASPAVEGRPGDNYFLDSFNAVTNKSFVPEKGRIPLYPENIINMGLTWRILTNLSAYIGTNWMDVRRNVATNPIKSTKQINFVKTNIRWDDAFAEGLFIQLQINNLFNQQFFDPGARTAEGLGSPTLMPLEGRNWWLTMGYKF